MTQVRWIRSSYSGNQGDCVEVAPGIGGVRDSKNPGPELTFTPTTLRTFLAQVRDSRV